MRNTILIAVAMFAFASGDADAMRAHWDLAVASYPDDRDGVLALVGALSGSGAPGMKELLEHAVKNETGTEK
mgnify:CR=1 FL=1